MFYSKEMGLEIICRIVYHLLSSNEVLAQQIVKGLPAIFHSSLSSKSGVIGVLKDMRPLLTDTNKSNPNILSVKIDKVTIKSAHDSKYSASSTVEGWLDLCLDYICFHIAKIQQLIRFEYSAVEDLEIDEDNSVLQVTYFK